MKVLRFLILASTAASLQSCATYSCGEFPQAGCQPVSEVYKQTNQGFNDYRKTMNGNDKGQASAGGGPLSVSAAASVNSLNYITPGDPVLSKPKILRILVTTWEDSDKDLHAGGFIYVKVRDSEWAIKQ